MAEYNDFNDTLEKMITCDIHNGILTEPKTLPCQHTVCFTCIKSCYQVCKKEGKPFKCPSCKTTINVHQGDVVNLPTWNQHYSLIQLYNTIKNNTSDQQQLQQCISCSKRCVVVGLCFQCGVLCSDCMNAHKTMSSLKDTHQATLWNEFKKENMSSYIDYNSFCKEKHHEKTRLEFYCQTCKKCICQKCAIATSHSAHDKVSMEEASERAKELIGNEKNRLSEVVKMYKKKLSDLNLERIKKQVDEARAKVRSVTQVHMKILQDKEDAIIASLNDFLADQTTSNDEEKIELDAKIQQALGLQNQCQAIDDSNLKQFILEGHEQLEEVCKATVKGASILSKKPVKRNSTVRFIPNQDAIKSVQELQFGKIIQSVTDPSRCSIETVSHARCGFSNHFNIVTKDTEGDVCYITNKGSIDVQIQDIDGNDVQAELTESQIGKYIVKYEAQKPSPYKVVVSIEGEPIRNSPKNIRTIDAKAEIKPVRVFKIERAPAPVALAVSDTGEVAVVSNDQSKKECRVVLFSADGKYLREFGGEGPGDSRLSYPWGVAFNTDRLLVTDNQDGYGCIKEFDIHGNFKRTVFKQKGMELKRMCTTEQSIACLTDDKDSKKTLIKLVSKQTGDLLQYIKLDIDIRLVWFPMFLASRNNRYFVSFHGSNSINVFNENGGLLYGFGEKGQEQGQFSCPHGLALFGADMLLVCDLNNHRIQLLNQNGQFIRSFGSRGSGFGEMNGPIDVVVTPNGQVFVLEIGKRVHVFR